jgi:hypothetical protein
MAVDLAYDESGEGDVLLVSMQIGMTQKAKRMKKLWRKELARAGIPYFHSKDFDNYTGGVFRDLSRQTRERLLDSLAQLARLRLEIGLTARISKQLFRGMTDHKFRSKYATEYSFAIQMLILSAHLYLERFELGFDVNIVVEEGHRNSGQVLQILRDLKTAPKGDGLERLNILSVGLGSKKDHPILQASDMLAYSEWQKTISGDTAIYDALHIEWSRYKPEVFDCDACLVHIGVEGAREYEALLQQAGRQKQRTGVLAAMGATEADPRTPRRRNPC